MHIHLGILLSITTFLHVIIIGFFWRVIAGHLADSTIGQAMAFVY
jgi:hypothetical protein